MKYFNIFYDILEAKNRKIAHIIWFFFDFINTIFKCFEIEKTSSISIHFQLWWKVFHFEHMLLGQKLKQMGWS